MNLMDLMLKLIFFIVCSAYIEDLKKIKPKFPMINNDMFPYLLHANFGKNIFFIKIFYGIKRNGIYTYLLLNIK